MKGGRPVGSGTVQLCDECMQPASGELYHVHRQWRCPSCTVKLLRDKERQSSTILASTTKFRKEVEEQIRREKKARSARERRQREQEARAARSEEDRREAEQRQVATERAHEYAEQVRAAAGQNGPYRGPTDRSEAGCESCGQYDDGKHAPDCPERKKRIWRPEDLGKPEGSP